MLQEFWDEGYGAEGDDEAYNWDTDERQISDQEAGTAHDSMQVPTSATGHEEEALAAATGHEEAQAMATSQEKKSAATGDNEQALAEAPSAAIVKGLLKDIAAFSEMSLEASCPCGATGSGKYNY